MSINKKVKTLAEIKSDPRIVDVIKDYDGNGKHMIECAKGYGFEANNSTIEIGNVKELCYEVNERLIKQE